MTIKVVRLLYAYILALNYTSALLRLRLNVSITSMLDC